MSNQTISLKSRVRYEGRAQIFDRRAKKGADLEKLPDPVWRMIGLNLRTSLKEATQARATAKTTSPK